jgi:plasmid stabilization system protein ParE
VKHIEFGPAARDELAAAVDSYETDYPGRGIRFAGAVARTATSAAAAPLAGTAVPEVPEALGLRRRIIQGFPFTLIYRVVGDTLRIEAVAHTRRRPGYWLRRIPSE